ncbi:MAG: hypothetical protein GY820_21310, partial [Gammaproteobacteria bacterium]|nr:hypothetical protein [Gammaproteobacteria bacterium]
TDLRRINAWKTNGRTAGQSDGKRPEIATRIGRNRFLTLSFAKQFSPITRQRMDRFEPDQRQEDRRTHGRPV